MDLYPDYTTVNSYVESINNYIKSISKDTGVNFFDLCDSLDRKDSE